MEWVEVPVMTGPIVRIERDLVWVTIECDWAVI